MNLIQIENRKGKLSFNDQVSKESADKLLDELGKLYGHAAVMAQMKIGEVMCAADDAVESVEVVINSPGGSVMEGTRIYNALRGISARGVEVVTVVNGLAASMGSVILAAGDVRKMEKGSRVMIHEASTMAYGDAKTMRRNADLLESISAEIAGIYAERTGRDIEEMRNLMLAETWMDAEKAKELGFIHSVITHEKADVSNQVDIRPIDPTKTDMKLIDRLTSPSSEEAVAQISALETQISAHDSEIQSFKDRIDVAEAALQEAAGFKAEIENYSAEVTALKAERDLLTAELTEAKAASVTVEETAAVIATEVLASIGQPEPLAEVVSDITAVTTRTREEFNALKPSERLAFVKGGGKIK